MMENPIQTKQFRVTRKCIVNVTTSVISCSSPVTAVIAADNLSNYETLLRQIVRDGIAVQVELDSLDGAIVDEFSDELQCYSFEEVDLQDIKDSFGVNNG